MIVPLSFASMLEALKAAGEETRLRILLLLAEGELSVSDLVEILQQSQPRISRHLRILTEAGLVLRHREGAWAFFRLSPATPLPLPVLSSEDSVLREDRQRLQNMRNARQQEAQNLFARLAPQWDQLRALHAPEVQVEAAMRTMLEARPYQRLIDLGTGTGRMLQVFAPHASEAVGLDSSRSMLAVARANLEREGLGGVILRQGDLSAPPEGLGRFDLAIMHQVLHFLDDPASALRRAGQVLLPGGRLLIVDFAPHDHEILREKHGHRRLGFSDAQIAAWLDEAGLDLVETRLLHAPSLTVALWLAQDRRIVTDKLTSLGMA